MWEEVHVTYILNLVRIPGKMYHYMDSLEVVITNHYFLVAWHYPLCIRIVLYTTIRPLWKHRTREIDTEYGAMSRLTTPLDVVQTHTWA